MNEGRGMGLLCRDRCFLKGRLLLRSLDDRRNLIDATVGGATSWA
jgi:hypothetical protein